MIYFSSDNFICLAFRTSQFRRPLSDFRLCKILTDDILVDPCDSLRTESPPLDARAPGTRLSLGVAACYSSLSPSWFFVRLFPVFILHIAIFGFGYQTIGIISKLFLCEPQTILMIASINIQHHISKCCVEHYVSVADTRIPESV